jgi:hypothetical protein
VTRADDETWVAFVEFAPYAYDASVWGRDGRKLIALSDCARSIVVEVDLAEVDPLAGELQAAGLPAFVSPRTARSAARAQVRARARREPMF